MTNGRIYRLYVSEWDKDGYAVSEGPLIDVLQASVFAPRYTVIPTLRGCVVEIIASPDYSGEIRALAVRLKDRLNQESVLVTAVDCQHVRI